MGRARYDGLAEWYDAEFADAESGHSIRRIAVRLLGEDTGRLLDVGCGTGAHTSAFAELGWTVTGIDISEDMLRLARRRGVDVVAADASRVPFEADSFDAAVSLFTHTDVDDFAAVVREVARVLRSGSPFVYVGVHPCFVGPHSSFVRAEGVPFLHPGYRHAARSTSAPGISPAGLRAKVGATHLPLGDFLGSFLKGDLQLEHFEEPAAQGREYPYIVALRTRR